MLNSIGAIRLGYACLRRSRYRAIGLLACVGALVAGTSPLQAQTSGPVAAYAFGETSGVIAVDSSSGGNDALANGPTRAAGRFGGGLQLDGIDDAVELPMSDGLTFSNAFTVEAWIAPAEFGRERSLWWTPAAMLSVLQVSCSRCPEHASMIAFGAPQYSGAAEHANPFGQV